MARPASTRLRIGKYEVLARIGQGGMADVFLARQTGPENFRKLVVIKRIHPHLARAKRFIDMFFDEARIAAQIQSPRVVQIYELGEAGGTYYIAMEYLAGETLAVVLKDATLSPTPLPPHLAARLIADAADGLHAAHELKGLNGQRLDVVHRDVSPSNVFVLYDGTVKVLDFGVAKAQGRMTETTGGHLKGKFAYMSPEQLTSRGVDRRSDVFALGAVLWESLAIRRLFRRESDGATVNAVLSAPIPPPSSVNAAVDPALDAIALRALSRKPEDRYQTALEMRDALEDFLHRRRDRVGHSAVRDYMHRAFAVRIEERERLIHRAEQDESFEIDVDFGAFEESLEGPPPALTGAGARSSVQGRKPSSWIMGAGAVLLGVLAAMFGARLFEPEVEPEPIRVPALVQPAEASAKSAPLAPVHPAEPAPTTTTSATPEPTAPPVEERAVLELAPPVRRSRASRRSTRSTARAEQKIGHLYLATMPRSRIYEGSRDLGDTPLINVSLPEGEHLLVAVDSETGEKKQIRVRIEADQETRVLKKLAEE